MPQARTRHFATIEYDEGAVLHFPNGLPAFEDQKRFVLLERPSTAPVVFLQSLDSENLCLPAVLIRAVEPGYELSLGTEDLEALELQSIEQVAGSESIACLAVLSVPADGPATANLLAPLVVNFAAKRGVQAVRADPRYSYRHPIGPDPNRSEASCS